VIYKEQELFYKVDESLNLYLIREFTMVSRTLIIKDEENLMGAVVVGKFGADRKRELCEEQEEVSQFTLEAFKAAVEQERYLPWNLAVILVRQVMIDHGIKLEDLEA
jgi:hypothetical protein